MSERIEHIVRRVLPWRSSDDALTECGLPAAAHSALSREAMEDKVKRQGQQRAALSSCMTCWTAVQNEQRGADPTFSVMERECSRVRFKERAGGERLGRELRALGMLAAAQDRERLDERECERIWNDAVDAEKREPDDFDYTISDDTDPPSDPLFRRIVKHALNAARAAGATDGK